MKTAGFVLVGGQSSRMGQDKARLLVNSRMLVEEIADTLAQAAGSVLLVGRPEAYADLGLARIPDLRPGLGPLSGLETILCHSQAEFNIVASCDIPGLQAEWFEQLKNAAESTGAPCVVAKDALGKVHPLCAVYRSACLPLVRQALDAGQLRLLDLIGALAAVEVPINAVIANVNTAAQWAHWRAMPA